MRPHILKAARDDDEQPIYSNLEHLESQKAIDSYMGERTARAGCALFT